MKYLVLIIIVLGQFTYAQIAMGKSTVDGSGILDFVTGTTKGIILPQVENSATMASVTPGTLVFDMTTSKVQYHNGAWVDLSTDAGTNPSLLAGSEIPETQGMVIGDASTVEGVLILESTDKALILPKVVDPENNVKNPYPGMLCYDPVKKLVSVFNGTNWFFWQKDPN